MRLPWPFRRSTTPSTGADITHGAGGGGSAWRRLPPIEGIVDRPPLVAPPAPFKAQLAGAHRPPPMLQRLGHERSASAPPGLVAGLARPTGVIRSTADMPLRRLQGRLRQWLVGDRSQPDEASGTLSEPALAAAQPAAETTTATDPLTYPATGLTETSAAPLVGRAPIGGRRPPARTASPGDVRPNVSRAVAAPPGNRYTRAGSAALPLHVARSAASPAPTEPPPMPASTSHLPSLERVVGPARRLRLGPPVERPAATTPSDSVAGAAGVDRGDAKAASSASQPEAVSAVSAPVSPVTPPPARTAVDGSPPARAMTPLFSLHRAPVGRPPEAASSGAGTMPDPAASGASAEAPASSAPTAQSIGAAHSIQRSASAPAVRPRPSARASAGRPAPAGRSLPLTGERGLRPTVSDATRLVQRAAEGGSGTTPRINRGSVVSDVARQLGARAFSLGNDVFIPAEAGPLDEGGGRALLAHELAHVRQHSGAASGSATADSTSDMEAEARQAEAWSLSADLSLARRGRPAVGNAAAPPSAAAAAATSPPTSSASVTDDYADANELAIEQALAASSAPTSAPASGPPLHLAEEGSAPPPAAAGSGTTPAPTLGERELQDLLRQLYPRLRTHLASELLVSRERAGLLTDI